MQNIQNHSEYECLSLCPKHCLLTCFWIVKVEELQQDSVIKKKVNVSLAVCKLGAWFDNFIFWLRFLNPTLRQNRSFEISIEEKVCYLTTVLNNTF